MILATFSVQMFAVLATVLLGSVVFDWASAPRQASRDLLAVPE